MADSIRPSGIWIALEVPFSPLSADVLTCTEPKGSNLKLHILLVEDSPAQVYLVKQALKSWRTPYMLHAVSTAEDALAFINREGDHSEAPTPHLTLLDLNLPREPGFTVLKAIKDHAQYRNIAVIVMSSSNNVRDIKKAVELHANAYIQKPVDWDDINKLFTTLETFWRMDARFTMNDPR